MTVGALELDLGTWGSNSIVEFRKMEPLTFTSPTKLVCNNIEHRLI